MDIDTCYHEVVSKLTKQQKIKDISQKLLLLTTNDERVLYVYNILEQLNAFPSALEVHKTESVSTHYRNLGNQCFQKKDDFKAWQYYNLSLMHAPPDSDNLSLALANRSAVFFSLKKFQDSLNDVDEVLSLKHPSNLKEKLVKRKLMCEENLAKQHMEHNENKASDIDKLLPFSSQRDPRFPCASTKLEVFFNKEMGRHVIAKEDIKVGEILAQEEPYFTLLLKDQYLFSCSYCLSRNLNLSPCSKCCFILYCSKKCRENAWRDYHSVECNLMAILINLNFSKLELLALRTVIKSRQDHSDWLSLLNTVKEAEENLNNELRGHVKVDGEWIFDSKYYPSIHTLESNIDKRTISDIFQKCVTAAVLLRYLLERTDFLKVEDKALSEKILSCVAGNLLLHTMTSATNMHGLGANIESADGDFVEEVSIASAPYAFHSLINHSCAPNVVRFNKLGASRMTLFALRPIKKGMQIFDNYGSHHALQDRKTRRESLKFQYKFTCLCEACDNDWPTYFGLKPAKDLPLPILRKKQTLLDENALNKLKKGHKGTALKLFKPLCDLAETLEFYAPCVELADCQEAIKQCLAIFENLVPFGYSNIVDWQAKPPL